jgi:hypothetical protein
VLDIPDTVWEICANASIEGVEHFRDSVSDIRFAAGRFIVCDLGWKSE